MHILLIKNLLAKNFFSPSWCYCCQELLVKQSPAPSLCLNCYQKLPFFPKNSCSFCLGAHESKNCLEKNVWQIEQFNSVFYYQKPLSNWLIEFKYGKKMLPGRILTSLLCDYLNKNPNIFRGYDCVIPVPSFLGNPLIRRQFSSNNYFVLNSFFNKMVYLDVKKAKKIPKQVFLDKKARQKNMQNSQVFFIDKKLSDKKIILFDDVCTTGATIKNIIKKLKASAVAKISLITLFREPLKF